MKDDLKTRPKVYVSGSTGMVGSAIRRRLLQENHVLVDPPAGRVDLRDQAATRRLIGELRPDWLVLAAAKVGGIHANNTYPAEFIRDNVMIQTNLIHSAYEFGVKKLLFLGSACIYPRLAPQPMREEYLLSGALEPTNEPYAVAKIAGIVMCQSYNRQYGTNFICVMPNNLYGPEDNFHLRDSHVLPALIRKVHEAKESGAESVEVWGTGKPLREFLHVDDLADACAFLMDNYDRSEIVNVGSGEEVSIRDLALLIKEVVEYDGEIRFDPQKPDGMPRKLLDVTRITALGWKPRIGLAEGLRATYKWYLENRERLRS